MASSLPAVGRLALLARRVARDHVSMRGATRERKASHFSAPAEIVVDAIVGILFFKMFLNEFFDVGRQVLLKFHGSLFQFVVHGDFSTRP